MKYFVINFLMFLLFTNVNGNNKNDIEKATEVDLKKVIEELSVFEFKYEDCKKKYFELSQIQDTKKLIDDSCFNAHNPSKPKDNFPKFNLCILKNLKKIVNNDQAKYKDLLKKVKENCKLVYPYN
tara:strand:+ start:1085 stop:1459 length:375 start_codon:yes stop_codon:yes gene_type:complete